MSESSKDLSEELQLLPFQVGSKTASWARQSKLTLHFHEEINSTNTSAKDLSIDESGIQLVVTNHQTAGRGRGANTWQDQSGSTLLCSWVFDLQAAPLPTTTCRIGLAVVQALKATWPWLEISLKAPNDIYLGTNNGAKKLSGILLENIQQGTHNRIIIGIGLNVFNQPDLDIATSLTAVMKDNPVTEIVWQNFLDRLLLELTFAIGQSYSVLSLNDRSSLLFYLNLNPNLSEKYISIDEKGSLTTITKTISWLEL